MIRFGRMAQKVMKVTAPDFFANLNYTGVLNPSGETELKTLFLSSAQKKVVTFFINFVRKKYEQSNLSKL